MKYLFIILGLAIVSCSTVKDLPGTYSSNFADMGFFITSIEFNRDSTFRYKYSGDMIHQDLNGTYKVWKKHIYLKFNSEKFHDFDMNDSISFQEYMSGKHHDYDLKEEQGIAYHLKYKFSNRKIFSYTINNGKMVRFSKILFRYKAIWIIW